MAKLNLTEEQKEKLRVGYRRALEIPESLDMSRWAQPSDNAPCGTAVCYAGELCLALGEFDPRTLLLMEVEEGNGFTIAQYAANLVGIPLPDLYDRLFFATSWPTEAFRKYESTNIPRVRAEALRDAVEHFIEKDGDW